MRHYHEYKITLYLLIDRIRDDTGLVLEIHGGQGLVLEIHGGQGLVI